jgi:hypothetical protein
MLISRRAEYKMPNTKQSYLIAALRQGGAVLLYAGFAVYLYQPYFKHFDALRFLSVINACLGCLGGYVLSRRWITSFWCSFFAGATYGFGPFALWLAGYHPTAGFLVAAVPWLFCPAAFGPKVKWRWVSWLLSALPFLAIISFFQLSARWRLFAIPVQTKLNLSDLAFLLAPLASAERGLTPVGFYHVPLAFLIVGGAMLLAARRFGILIIFAVGVTLAFCNPVFNVSPVIWLTTPLLCCSIIIGAGMQGIVCAGFTDRKLLLITAAVMAAISIAMLLLATECFQIFAGLGAKAGRIFAQAAKMYILGAVAITIIFFTARAKSRVHLLRLTVLCSAAAIDIFLGARFIVDSTF